MKKMMVLLLGLMLFACMLAGCAGSGNDGAADGSADVADGAESSEGNDGEENSNDGPITVVRREDGSGTHSAFIELFAIEEEDESGEAVDMTTLAAEITNSTAVMMTTVAGNVNAIGYVSLGSLSDSVKALAIDGVAATVENIENGSYAISRPFNIATLATVSDAAQDFIDFILSADGQAVVTEEGYISVGDAPAFTSAQPEGTVVVAGSSSVTPVMEALKEAYAEINPNVTIEIQQSDSSTGMTVAMEGSCDIGMASRELKDSELAGGLTPTVIALDGIAVIVNNDNPLDNLTADQVKAIFTGAVANWGELE